MTNADRETDEKSHTQTEKDRLPLLRQKKYFSQTRYGYARGDEARNYVENIRRYYQSIIGHLEQQNVISVESGTDDLTVIHVEQEQLRDQDIENEELEAQDEDQDINNEENEEVSIEPDQTEDLNENEGK